MIKTITRSTIFDERSPCFLILLAFIIAVSLIACTKGTANSEATSVIEQAWNQRSLGLVSGEVRFIGGLNGHKPDPAKGEDAVSELPFYRFFSEKGYITLTEVRENKDGGWGGFFQMAMNGVIKTARVTITPLGRQNGEVESAGNVEELWVPIGTARIEEIVSNELYSGSTEQYRVVQGTHTWELDQDLAAAYAEARGTDTLGRERKFRALLVFDAFEKKWKYLMADFGPRTGQFTSNNVEQAVMAHQLTRSTDG